MAKLTSTNGVKVMSLGEYQKASSNMAKNNINQAQKAQLAGIDNEQAALRDSRRQALTDRMDAEARNQASQYAQRTRSGLYAGDGGAVRGVRVSNNRNTLRGYEEEAKFEKKRKNLADLYKSQLASANTPRVTTLGYLS